MQNNLEATAGIREGDVVAGKYRIDAILGAGGMGVVVAARHLQLDEKVAIKFLLPEMLDNPEVVARFQREAQAAVKIKSEHVARVFDVGALPDGAPYIVMEFLQGSDLAEWLKRRGALPVEQAVDFVVQACLAVAESHALGIIHRDLKPANLFCILGSDGQLAIKVLDFGISKIHDASGSGQSVTKTKAVMGSPSYMSPEQLRSSKNVDARTDIWALGVILFELLANRLPFTAETVTELVIKIATEPAPALRDHGRDVPLGLDAIVSRCLEKEPDRRYANVAALAAALAPFAPSRAKARIDRIVAIIHAAGMAGDTMPLPPSSFGIVPGSPGTAPPVGRTIVSTPRRRRAVIGVGAFAVLAVGVAARLGFLSQKAVSSSDDSRPVSTEVSTSDRPAASLAVPAEPAAATSSSNEAPSSEQRPPPRETSAAPARPTAASPAPAVPAKSRRAVKATGPSTAASSAPARPAPARAECDPPYYFDVRGNRIFKQECL